MQGYASGEAVDLQIDVRKDFAGSGPSPPPLPPAD